MSEKIKLFLGIWSCYEYSVIYNEHYEFGFYSKHFIFQGTLYGIDLEIDSYLQIKNSKQFKIAYSPNKLRKKLYIRVENERKRIFKKIRRNP